MIILDTDVVSDLMRPRPSSRLIERLAEIDASEQATTAITIGELAYGAQHADRHELYERAVRLLSGTRVLPFDRDAAERYGSIRSELEREGRRLPDPDLRIAATALAHRAVLITGNLRHFERVPGLDCEDWLRG
jgi:predicted nucleic acid-binding protein